MNHLSRSEIIESFLKWMNEKSEGTQDSYRHYLKKETLEEWDKKYFGNSLFEIDYESPKKFISKIRKLNYGDKKWLEYSLKKNKHAPRALIGNENYLSFLNQEINLKNYSTINNQIIIKTERNFFVIWTKDSSIDKLAGKDLKKDFWFSGCYQRRDLTNIGDIVFFVQKGEETKITWERGLSAICEIIEIRNDINDKKTKKGEAYFDLKLKPVLSFPKILDKSKFKDYASLKDIAHIATVKQDPNQVNWLFPKESVKNLVGVLLGFFPELKEEINKIFGEGFANEVKPLNTNKSNSILKDIIPNEKSDYPFNLIIYGAPGTGKSYEINQRIEKHFNHDDLYTRIIFHSNYSYRNFVGSYKPKPLYKVSDNTIYKSDFITVNEHQKEPIIEYTFEAGPFLIMLEKALRNPKHNFLIVIEELNRANAASVFGDIFQLLDRNNQGESEYPITLEPSANDYLKSIGLTENKVRIPSNLYLWATMNNADQGVLPLDSAFKRRWNFEHIGLNKNEIANSNIFVNLPFIKHEKNKLEWNKFRKIINEKLIDLSIHEDKLIGPFFLSKKEIEDSNSLKNKLLLYLKEDVLRYKTGVFKSDLKTFSRIAEEYDKGNNVFDENLEWFD